MAFELEPHELPLRGKIDPLLRRGQPLDRLRVKRRCSDIMGERSPGNWGVAGHFVLPPCKRIRGSRKASAISEMRTPTTVRQARNIRKEPARYMSWLCKARSNNGPVVCSDRTMATISAPETIEGKMLPMSETKKFRDMRNGYLTSA